MKNISFITLFLVAIFHPGAMGYTIISADSLYSWISKTSKPFLLDVRETYEYNPKHIEGSVLYPWNSGVLQKRYPELPPAIPIVVICASGYRSGLAAAFLDTVNLGRFYGFIYQLSGGLSTWKYKLIDSTAVVPLITVDKPVVSFGFVYVDSIAETSLIIYNRHALDFTLSRIFMRTSGIFSVDRDSAGLVPGDSLIVNVSFNPRAAQAYSDTIFITSETQGGVKLAVNVTGKGITPMAGDIDNNGKRDIFDLLELLKNLNSASPSKKADVNSDGKVDIFDLLALLRMLSAG